MSQRFQHLLSPLPVGKVLLKNRMIATAATPHYIQGVERFPTEKWVTLLTDRAKGGAAAVFINHLEQPSDEIVGLGGIDKGGTGHFSNMDITGASTQNYLCQMIDMFRYYGSIAVTQPVGRTPEQFERAGEFGAMPRDGGMPPSGKDAQAPKAPVGPPGDDPSEVGRLSKGDIQFLIDDFVNNARRMKSLGFEMLTQHSAYRCVTIGKFLSPRTNQRSDEYGGDVHGRGRILVELFDALKQTLGQDFPLEVLISGYEENGVTVADNIELARMLEGKVDVIHVRNGEQDPQHPTGFTSTPDRPCPNLEAAAAIKQSIVARGGKTLVAVSAGLQDPDFNEKILAEGKADIIAMARAWICDFEYGKKIMEGRPEDIIPCVRCNKCHVPNVSDKFRSFCTVNPRLGIEDRLDKMIAPVTGRKKVAVIGGGPGGMYAAMTAARRGHIVNLYEKAEVLGGQLTHADYASFKWPMKRFKDYLINQVYAAGVKVHLGIVATKELLLPEEYDHVIVSIGPAFTRPDLPGIQGPNVIGAMDVYGNESLLPKKIVIMGGSETGVETGMYLAENGHDVTVMTRQEKLASDAAQAHYVSMLRAAYQALPTFHPLTRVTYKAVEPDGVVYLDQNGQEQRIRCDLVVCCTGTASRPSDTAAFYGAGRFTHYVGDCIRPGNVHQAVTEGYGCANQI